MKISLILFAVLMTIRCGSGSPVEYSAVCDKTNNEKRVQVVGYLDNDGSAMCSTLPRVMSFSVLMTALFQSSGIAPPV